MTEEHIVDHQRIRLPYRYTAGAANTEFLRGLEAGRLVGARCDSCDIVVFPARPFCPSCAGRLSSWIEVADQGVVVASTVESTGRVVALVRLDGTDTHFPHVIDATGVRLPGGSRVRVRWGSDQVTEITAIAGFEPI